MSDTDDPHTDSMADLDSEAELQTRRATLKTQLEILKKRKLYLKEKIKN